MLYGSFQAVKAFHSPTFFKRRINIALCHAGKGQERCWRATKKERIWTQANVKWKNWPRRFNYQEPDASESPLVNISITGFPETIEEIEEISLSAGRGSAYETWLELKKPSYVNREILETLDAATHPEVNVYKEFRSSYQIKPASLLQFNIKLKSKLE